MAVLAVLHLVATDWAAYDLSFFAASLVLLLVGFTEEITVRGLLIVALRSRLHEVWVWLISTALFGLMHYANVLLGQGLGQTTQQVGVAFMGGTIFYILRRTTGSLVPAMVLHGFWDFSSVATGVGTPSPMANAASGLYIVVAAAAVICVAWVIRDSDERLR